jgi:hypothetical protein
MKNIILTSLALVAGVTLGYSQGSVTIANTTSAYFISTNNTSGAAAGGLTTGAAKGFDYTVLASSSVQGTTDADLVNSSMWTWTGITAATGLSAGSIGTPNTTISASGTFGVPTGGSYASAPTEYYVIVAWSATGSASEGTSWATVSSELANNTLVAGGYFGVSPVAYEEAGGGPESLGATPLVAGNAITLLAGAGLTGGFQVSPVPEPTTIALGVLGAASLLALRRKKA